MTDQYSAAMTPFELAAHLAARMCHDFISPAGAIASGLDLLDDPSAQDMREDALRLIAQSTRKLLALLEFDRVAFGASAAAESFSAADLERLTRDVFAHGRAQLDWAVEVSELPKPAARTLLNLAQIGGAALPTGGTARIEAVFVGDEAVISIRATGPRARLRPEVVLGLEGEPLADGLAGHWIQAYYVRNLLDDVQGQLEIALDEGEVRLQARLRR
jgi:histidine phosphotransferase ChpT